MALLKDKDREFLTKEFGKLTEPVKLVYFTQEHECPYCETTGQIVSEVAGLSDKITTAVYDFVADKALAGKYRVDKIPAIVVERGWRHCPGGGDQGGAGNHHAAGSHSSLLHPHLTILPGSRAACPADGGGVRAYHRRHGGGHRVPSTGSEIRGDGSAQDRGQRDGELRGRGSRGHLPGQGAQRRGSAHQDRLGALLARRRPADFRAGTMYV
jgi:thiol-disulfide isomerase/thioredoxin